MGWEGIKDNSRVLTLTTGRMKLLFTMMKTRGNRCCGGNQVLIYCIVMSINAQMVMGSKLREILLGSSGDKLRIWM